MLQRQLAKDEFAVPILRFPHCLQGLTNFDA